MSDQRIYGKGDDKIVATTHIRSSGCGRLLTTTTALASLALAPLSFLTPDAAYANCGIVGTGTVNAPNTGDIVECTGPANTSNVAPLNQTNVTINIGDGTTPTTMVPPVLPPVELQGTSGSFVTVKNGATINAVTNAIILDAGSNNNAVSVHAGGFVGTTAAGTSGIVVNNSNSNAVTIGGTVQGLAALTNGVFVAGTSANNTINVLSGGFTSGYNTGVSLVSDGNTINNAGTIAALDNYGILVAGHNNTIINSGTITAGTLGTAVQMLNAGTLELRPGSSIIGNVRGASGAGFDVLRLGGTGEGLFNLNLLGPGQQYDEFEILTKNGTASWTLIGTSTFNGSVDISSGGFIVNGTLPASISLNGGVLGGNATIGTLAVNAGTVAPGNSIGTLNVNGNVTFTNGSFYNAEINGAGQSDLISATGTATLNGGTVKIIPLGTGFKANTQYTILTAAGGVTGTFSALAPLPAPLVQGQLTYDANNAYFLLQQVVAFSSLTGLTPNQYAVSGALDQASLGGGASASLANAVDTLAVLSDVGIKEGLNDLAGQVLADSRRFTVDQASAFQNFMWGAGVLGQGNVVRVFVPMTSSYASEPNDPIRNAMASKAQAKAMAASGYGVWTGAYGNWDRVSASSIAFGANSFSGGAALGVEYSNGNGFRAGVAAGGSTGKLRSGGRADSVSSDSGHIGAYARGEVAGLDIAGAISYAFASLDSTRSIGFLGQTATGNWQAQTLAATFGLSRLFRFGNASAQPFARLDWTGTRHRALNETGAPGVNQLVGAGHHDVLSGSSGVRLGYHTTGANDLPASLGATLGVRHDFSGTTPAIATSFEGAPNIPFTITGVARPATRLLAGAEASWAFTAATSLSVSYEGAFAPDYTQHRLQAAIRTAF